MPGIWNKSGNQVFGLDGTPEVGARCYFFEASSSTPLTTYTDYSLAVQNPAFVETDSYGRWPAVFLDDSTDSFFRERATDAGGSVVYFDNDVIPIIGPGEGGGAPETPVDPNALLQTGDFVLKYTTGTKAGFVRANGRTIGSAVSGASERANADTQDLFEFLYNIDANLAVSGGRGASATADYEANKTLTLPDCRGRVLAGLDDMGASAAGILTGFTTLGETMGDEEHALTAAELPANIPNSAVSTTTLTNATNIQRNLDADNSGTGSPPNYPHTNSVTITAATSTTVTINPDGGDAHSIVQPSLGLTIYIKL